MNVNKKDPRIAALALGELDGDERDAIERAIAADPELQEFVKEIGVAANLAGLALQQEDAPGLKEEQRQAILDAANLGGRHGVRRRVSRIVRVAAMAAFLALGLGAYSYWMIVNESATSQTDGAKMAREIHELDSLRLLTVEPRNARDADSTAALESEVIPRTTSFEVSERVSVQPRLNEPAKEDLTQLPASIPVEELKDVVVELRQERVLDPAPTPARIEEATVETNVADLLAAAPLDDSAGPTTADAKGIPRSSNLKNVQVGGEIRIRKNYYAEFPDARQDAQRAPRGIAPATTESATSLADAPEISRDVGTYQPYFGPKDMNQPESPLAEQPVPRLAEAAPESQRYVSQRTRLNVKADFDDSNGIITPAPGEQSGSQEQEQQLAQLSVPPIVPSGDALSSVINAAPDPGPAAGQVTTSGEGNPADVIGSYNLSYDVDGDGVAESIPSYTKPDGSTVIHNSIISGPITDGGGRRGGTGAGGLGGQGSANGGGFGGGGGGFGAGGQSSNQFSTTIENGALGDRLLLGENEARAAGQNITYNRFVGDGAKLSRDYSDPNSVNLYIDLDSYDVWGEDFRSDYVTGSRRVRADDDDDEDDVRIYQAYIDADERSTLYAVRRVRGSESYAPIPQKPFTQVSQEPLSTFSVDVDTASYTNVRRFLTQGQLPPPDAVRVEEMINYFDYEYAQPRGEDPISVDVEIAQCVWETQHRLARIALKAREVAMDDRGPANLVFLVDVSGSMKDANKLPLLKESMKALTRQLQPQDRVAIVTYRDAASIALSPTTVGDKITVETAINGLHAEGSTNGAGGLELAFSIASEHVIPGGINRVILATDGDFNVGETDNKRLVKLIRNSAATGVFLTVLGFGEGNLKDDRLETIADKGDGTYHYIDNYSEATRVLCAQVGATLATVAKDVKVQVEFNPRHVSAYRLIGYENRALAAADFNNDRKDAGEMGSGESVTALYELVPAGVAIGAPGVDGLKYQPNPAPSPPPSGEANPETMTVKIRYKEPEGDASRKFEVPVVDRGQGYDQSSRDYRWAVAVAGFGSLLRHPPMHHVAYVNDDGALVTQANVENPERPGTLTLAQVREIAEGANGYDPDGRRAEFISLVVALQTLTGQ